MTDFLHTSDLAALPSATRVVLAALLTPDELAARLTTLGDSYYAFRRGEEGGAERLAHCLSFFERNAGRWRDRFGFAEIAYLPWVIRLRDLLGFDLSPYPAVLERLEQLSHRPSVAAELDVVSAMPR